MLSRAIKCGGILQIVFGKVKERERERERERKREREREQKKQSEKIMKER